MLPQGHKGMMMMMIKTPKGNNILINGLFEPMTECNNTLKYNWFVTNKNI